MATIAVVGAGMMGSAMCVPLADRGHAVHLIGTPLDAALVRSIQREHRHPTLGVELPLALSCHPVSELEAAAADADAIVVGVSSAGVGWAASALAPVLARRNRPLLMLSKGLEQDAAGLRVLTDAFRQALPRELQPGCQPVAVCGPCIAGELARRAPTLVAFTGRDLTLARRCAELIETPYYHVAIHPDVVGAQLCAALKNAYAMGIGFGAGLHQRAQGERGSVALHNYEAALFAQSLVEMQELVLGQGGGTATVLGLPGSGDLTVTCNGGRTGRFGALLGLGHATREAIRLMQGATLECLEVLAVLERFLSGEGPGRPDRRRLPLLSHLIDVGLHGAPVNVPFQEFFPRVMPGRWLLAVTLGLAAGCDCGSARSVAPTLVEPRASEPPGAVPGPLALPADAVPRAPAAPAPPAARAPSPDPHVVASRVGGRDATLAAGSVVGSFILDTLVDLAEAGPATATERGVAMVNRENELLLAPLGAPLRVTPKPRATPLGRLPRDSGPFPLAKGPAVRDGYAYWVSRGRLLRRSLASAGPGSVPETLGEDARVGTRVAVPVGAPSALRGLPQLAAYVARAPSADAPLGAKLWIEGRSESLTLTDEISSAHSVALVATGQGLAAIYLEARTGMSSLHYRPIALSKAHDVSLGEDRVVWVGGPSRSSTEFLAQTADGSSALGLMTLERDITHFGLFTLRVPLSEAPQPPDADWLLYENGIEPAPFASVELCGRRLVVLARPSSAAPKAPQELVLLELERPAAPAIVLARGGSFFDVSLYALGPGALLAYVSDQRTWGRSLRCSPA